MRGGMGRVREEWGRGPGGARPRPPRVAARPAAAGVGCGARARLSACAPGAARRAGPRRPLPACLPADQPHRPAPGAARARTRTHVPLPRTHPTSARTPSAWRLGGVGGRGRVRRPAGQGVGAWVVRAAGGGGAAAPGRRVTSPWGQCPGLSARPRQGRREWGAVLSARRKVSDCFASPLCYVIPTRSNSTSQALVHCS